MLINYNGRNFTVENVQTLKDFLKQQSLKPNCTGIAVAINEQIIPKSQWGSHQLQDGDCVEVVHAVQGG